MDFTFTEEQLALKRMARDFFEREVRPVGAEIDARPDPKDCYPAELVRKGSELGLRTLAIPGEYGGGAVDLITRALILSETCEVEVGTAKVFSQCWKVSQLIAEAGNEEQKKKFLPEFAEDHDYVTGISLTEPTAGSEIILPYTEPDGGLMLSVKRDGDDYILNGQKTWTSLAGWAKLLLVFARTDKSLPVREGSTTFLVPKDLPGISYGRVWDKMGFRLYPQVEVFFDNVRVPGANMIGKLNEGFVGFRRIFRGSVEIPCLMVGLSRAVYNLALEHAKERVSCGKPIIEHQAVGLMLTEMKMLIDHIDSYIWKVVWHVKNDPDYDVKMTRFAKVFSSDSAIKIAIHGLEILGGAGIVRENPMEKLVRDIITFQHGDATNRLNLLRAVPYL